MLPVCLFDASDDIAQASAQISRKRCQTSKLYLGRSLSDVIACVSYTALHKAALPPLLTLLLLPQARSQAIEAQLASTVAELCNLRVRQQHLESRNQLLEKCSSLTSRQHSDQVSELRFSPVRDGLTGIACLADCTIMQPMPSAGWSI